MSKNSGWKTYKCLENCRLLKEIGTNQPGLYYIMFDVEAKVIRVKDDRKEYKPISIKSAEDALSILEKSEEVEQKWREYSGYFTKEGIAKIPDDLKGLYFIHNPDSETIYLGKSDAIKGVKSRLECHLNNSSNKALGSAVKSGEKLSFYCWESPDPDYEEAIEIKRMKRAGLLAKQRRENNPLIYLDSLERYERENFPNVTVKDILKDLKKYLEQMDKQNELDPKQKDVVRKLLHLDSKSQKKLKNVFKGDELEELFQVILELITTLSKTGIL